ncbi:phosphoenolpyruvate--protein phosphotransferase [Verrucomicrobiota bacterium]
MMRKDNVDLICSVAELSSLFEKSSSLNDFLQSVAKLVCGHMGTDVCSIYMLDSEQSELEMVANTGLNPASIGSVRLHVGEGLTGLAMRELRPICVGRASQHPFFKHIPGIQEEGFESFLAVPIFRGLERIGVLVLQQRARDYFSAVNVKALRAIAAQLAHTIESANLLMSMHRKETKPEPKKRGLAGVAFLRGKAATSGIAFGKAAVMDVGGIDEFLDAALDDTCVCTPEDFERALKVTEEQLERLQAEMEEQLGDVAALIFSAHLLILKDQEFSGSIARHIEKGCTPREAVLLVVNQFIDLFAKSPNPRMREKIHDIEDLGHRLLHNLLDPEEDRAADYDNHVIIANAILPSDVIRVAAQHAEGLILLSGGMSAHISILARSVNLPLIVIDDQRLLKIGEGTDLLMDADQATLYIEPDEGVQSRYAALAKAREKVESGEGVKTETYTSDGERVTLLANVNLVSDLKTARVLKAEGIGLYRSEFPFLIRDDFPMEEEQFRIYRKLAREMEGREVTYRTLDIGGDKMLSYYSHVDEANPFLGLRAIRFSFRNRDIFGQQIRAMLRASAEGNVRIMFPMIASVDEFLDAKEFVEECMHELDEDGFEYDKNIKLGVMIELPSAVEVCEELAELTDFMSIGTNDLIQYIIGVDRTNEQVAEYYISHHPAVLRAINRVVRAGEEYDCDVSLCGDMAMKPRMLPFLLGCGLRKLSLSVHSLPKVQKVLEQIDLKQAEEAAEAMLAMSQIRQIESYLEQLDI